MTAILFGAGVALLVLGADQLVRGASRLALVLGMSPLAVGLTVVAVGTSAPEVAVSVSAAVRGNTDLAFGNVVGSNILNVLVVLGASALVAPLLVGRKLVRVDVPVGIAAALLAALLAVDGTLGRADGLVLVAGLAGYLGWTLRTARADAAGRPGVRLPDVDATRRIVPILGSALRVAAGLLLLVLGSRWLVTAAAEIARAFGVPELVVGLTILAGGTSLPEVATSLLAAVRGEREIAVGNVVGSNILNILGVLGLSAVVASEGVPVSPAALRFDLPFMLVVSFACLPIFASGHRIDRWEGALFLAYYAAYLGWVIRDAAGHGATPVMGGILVVFVLPLALVTLAIVGMREMAARRRR